MKLKDEILNELDLSDFSPDMQILVENVGMEIAKELVSKVGGMRFNIPMPSSLPGALERFFRKQKKHYGSYEIKQVAIELGVCENTAKKVYKQSRMK